jgi:hypothetical protein
MVAFTPVVHPPTVASRDIRGLVSLRNALGDRFVRGVIVYTGQEIIPMGDRLLALPVGTLFAGLTLKFSYLAGKSLPMTQ